MVRGLGGPSGVFKGEVGEKIKSAYFPIFPQPAEGPAEKVAGLRPALRERIGWLSGKPRVWGGVLCACVLGVCTCECVCCVCGVYVCVCAVCDMHVTHCLHSYIYIYFGFLSF